MIAENIIKIFAIGAASFFLAFFTTPLLTHFLYKHKMWRKDPRLKSIDGKNLSVFHQFHGREDTSVPRLGGLLIWITVLVVTLIFFLLSSVAPPTLGKLNFLSRSQTWLPLFALIAASLVGLTDDLFQIYRKGKYIAGGLELRYRLMLVGTIGLAGGWWFYFKLGYDTIHIPGNGDLFIGFWYIPLFIIVMLAVYSGGVIDGLDGLAGGVFSSIFAAFAAISLSLGQIDLAAFCFAILGSLLAFLWFNIPPARFYMGETGIIGLCAALTVVAFLTDSIIVLPIIALPLVIESASVILQLLSKKLRGKKIFLAAPLHHHLEAKGWPHYKVTMRFWVIGAVAVFVGVAIRLLG